MPPEKPGPFTLKLRRGTRYRKAFTYRIDGNPVDLTGYGARLQARRDYESAESFVNLSEGAGITILDGAVEHHIIVDISAVDTAAIEEPEGVFDLELIPNGNEAHAFALLAGRVEVAPQVTR